MGTDLPTANNTHDVLVMGHAASDIAPAASAELALRYNAMSSATITPRSREQVARFFNGLQMIPRGLVPSPSGACPARSTPPSAASLATAASAASHNRPPRFNLP
ncbi:MAG: SAM-dependent methyltransferase [Actinomycetota bacterium]|nr:SAM-dependent methyltransferase [Actinomycetota bacterium]